MRDDQREILRLAVPSDLPGGLDAARSGHFGHSPSFTIVDVIDDVMINTFMVPNQHHGKGDHGLSQVLMLVAGIGRKPLLTCLQAGMRVFAGEDRSTVRAVIQAFIDAELVPVGNDATALH
jgi:predicted Fe-Mo cluster-binding NifX family protein